LRVLVTGHKGYIGTVMVPILLGAGYEIVGLDSDLFHQCTFIPGLHDIPERRLDVRDVQRRDLEGFDAVIHLAALSNDPLGDLNPAITYEINHMASVRLARLAKEAGIPRFLYSSSCRSYGRAGDDLLDETAPLQPITAHRVRDLAKIVQDVVPGSRIEYARDGGPDPRCYRVDFGKIHRLLPDFKPRWDARRGVADLYAAYRGVRLTTEDCEGPRFKRIDHLKQLLAAGRVDETLRWKAA
jgi:nucleoside-diphosphate-sugar epimerase